MSLSSEQQCSTTIKLWLFSPTLNELPSIVTKTDILNVK